jgi:hypothetical protein
MTMMVIKHNMAIRAMRCYENRDFSMILGLRMPPKLANGVRRVALMAPLALIARIDHWRRHQPDVPNLSEAIRRLIEMGLETGERHDKKPKPKG